MADECAPKVADESEERCATDGAHIGRKEARRCADDSPGRYADDSPRPVRE